MKGTIEIDGYKLRYCAEGKGPNALVIGSAIYYPRSFSMELREHLRLVCVDWRGFGVGPERADPKITFNTFLDDIERVRNELKLGKCILIGHSANGILALEYAKKYPENVSHVVMIGISPSLGPEMAEAAHRHWVEKASKERKEALDKKLVELPDGVLAQLSPSKRFVAWCIRRAPQSWYDFDFDSSPLWEGVEPNMSMMDLLYAKELRDIDITRGLDKLDVPVFLALGRYDFIIAPAEMWEPVKGRFKNLKIQVFEKSGHSPQYEEPEEFDRALIKWLKS